MTWKGLLQNALRRSGYELTRYPVGHFLRLAGTTIVLDVGANVGQTGRELREVGYEGTIVSFEPMQAAFASLRQAAENDPAWQVVRCALGSTPGAAVINVASKSSTSSILPMTDLHRSAAPESTYVSKETIDVKRLDDVFDQYVGADDAVYLKIDVQGFEHAVLEGASSSLARVTAVQIELSLAEAYEGQLLMEDLMALLRRSGFVPVWLMHGFKNPATVQLINVDGIFLRADHLT